MSLARTWISSFIEHCLSSYETGRRDSGLSWEDDGSNIRFPSPTQQHAQINSWSADAVHTANLTDLDTQIDARLSRDSLQDYDTRFPKHPLRKETCRGYFIHLAEFELVYEYSTGKPKVHLYVKRFSIVWERDRFKGPPMGKTVPKKPALATLLKRVSSAIKNRHPPTQETPSKTGNRGRSNGYGDIPATQAIGGPIIEPAEHQLQTQIARHLPTSSPDPKRRVAAGGYLLEHLAQVRTPDIQPSRKSSANAQSLDPVSEPESRRRSASRVSANTEENLGLHQSHTSNQAAERLGTSPGDGTHSRPTGSEANLDQPSPKTIGNQVTPVTPVTLAKEPLLQEIERVESPFTPEKQLNSSLEASHVTLRPANLDKDVATAMVNPWEDMIEIRSIDVTVPMDQLELLDAERKPWYPPAVGEHLLSGNIPPALLGEWNQLVLQRQQEESDGSKLADDGRSKGPSTPISKRSSENEDSDEDSDDDLSDDCGDDTDEHFKIPWSTSPTRTPSRSVLFAQNPLPEDTPTKKAPEPPKSRQISGKGDNPDTTHPEQQDVQEDVAASPHNRNKSPDSVHRNEHQDLSQPQEQDPESASVKASERPHDQQGDVVDDPDILGMNDAGPRSSQSDNTESETSSDSEMEIIPLHPLSVSTQGVSSQAEGPSSSSASLPEVARQRVQVLETPAAALRKSHTEMNNQNAFQANVEMASQPDKSSSQSRILNTYPSNDGDSRQETSQESLRSAPAVETEKSNHMHVQGTPLNNEVPPTQPTPWSETNSVFTSSGPKVVETSAILAASTYQSQSSKAFSSYRDLPPSSMLSLDEQRSPSVQSSTQHSPLKIDRASPLKRSASEIGYGGCDSPSKRAKVDSQPTSQDLNIIANKAKFFHQEATTHAAQSLEASEIYKKFCSAYPTYTGDFEHFLGQCSRLRAFREGGSLQRPHLWDDFIIKHLTDYPQYLTNCMRNDTRPLAYEQHFANSFSTPTYTKRCLLPTRINTCAAQFIAVNTEPRDISWPVDTKTSFTESLRNNLSNFHAHSFAPTQYSSQNEQQQADWNDTSSEISIPDSEPARAAAQALLDEDRSVNGMRETTSIAPDWMPSDEEMEDADNDADIDGTMHETASVELGDEDESKTEVETRPTPGKSLRDSVPESPAANANANAVAEPESEFEVELEPETRSQEPFIPSRPDVPIVAPPPTQVNPPQAEPQQPTKPTASAQTVSDDEVEDEDEDEDRDEDQNENWFTSLRHITHPLETNGPSWSDDPNTPFKQWARRDQDVLSVRNQRGGLHVEVDENGVVRGFECARPSK
ncbi:uncharacterized protein BDV14DRAFT_148814 [Aspergillus stella-maris]|uniref:uncharacterized protein n=1 Tax=Aspergillus stella-maris TaxID=1810926 RepID=UPI003CCDD3B0